MQRSSTPAPTCDARVLALASISALPDDWRTACLKQLHPYDRLRMRLVSTEWALSVIRHVNVHSILHTADRYATFSPETVMRLMRRLGDSANYAKIAEMVMNFRSDAVWVMPDRADKAIVELAPVFMHAVLLVPDASLHTDLLVALHNFVCGCCRHARVMVIPDDDVCYSPCVNIFGGQCLMTDDDMDLAKIGARVWPLCKGVNRVRHEMIEVFCHALRHGYIELAEYLLRSDRIRLRDGFFDCWSEWIPEILRTGPMWKELDVWRPSRLCTNRQMRAEGLIRAGKCDSAELTLMLSCKYDPIKLIEAAIESGCTQMIGVVLRRFPPSAYHSQIEDAVSNICWRMNSTDDSFYRIVANRQPVCSVLAELVGLAEFSKPIVVNVPDISPRTLFLYDVYMALHRMKLETRPEYFASPDLLWSDAVVCRR
jgi:hypothetical protein